MENEELTATISIRVTPSMRTAFEREARRRRVRTADLGRWILSEALATAEQKRELKTGHVAGEVGPVGRNSL